MEDYRQHRSSGAGCGKDAYRFVRQAWIAKAESREVDAGEAASLSPPGLAQCMMPVDHLTSVLASTLQHSSTGGGMTLRLRKCTALIPKIGSRPNFPQNASGGRLATALLGNR